MIPAGKRDRKVKQKRSTIAQDPTGEPIETYAVLREIMMSKEDIQASERLRSNQELAEVTAVFGSLWFADLLTTDRLEYDGVDYDIIALAEMGRRAAWQITARAVRV